MKCTARSCKHLDNDLLKNIKGRLLVDFIPVSSTSSFPSSPSSSSSLPSQNQEKPLSKTAERELARANECIVCMETGPNVSLLCCGNHTHINCLKRWLDRGNHSCPYCRAQIEYTAEADSARPGSDGDDADDNDNDDDDDNDDNTEESDTSDTETETALLASDTDNNDDNDDNTEESDTSDTI